MLKEGLELRDEICRNGNCNRRDGDDGDGERESELLRPP